MAEEAAKRPEILECTVRDGNYAVDFKLTLSDTLLIVENLSRLGFKWIEIGHGLGLGAHEAGKGEMPSCEIEMIKASKQVSGESLLGAFFIPGVGREVHLQRARDAGLDFVRVGANVSDAPDAYPFIEKSRALGLKVAFNMMKSYAETPKGFASIARDAVSAGAEIIYCVDSAGSMMPCDVKGYLEETRCKVDVPLGFHGHNNLMMAVANCVEAWDSGATFLDATLCGMGRSAGNAPTEILVAVLERLGIETGFDLFGIMDVADKYLWPLVGRIRPNDMLGVASGYSQFHSSFLPKLSECARRHNADLKRLLSEVAQHNPVDLDVEFMESAAARLQGMRPETASKALVSFNGSGIAKGRISNTLKAAAELVDGLEVLCAKRQGSHSGLLLTPSESPVEGLVMAEFLLESESCALGRLVFGSEPDLERLVEATSRKVGIYLVDSGTGWAAASAHTVAKAAGRRRTIPVCGRELKQAHLADALRQAALLKGDGSLLLWNSPDFAWGALALECPFRNVFAIGASAPGLSSAPRGTVFLPDWPDRRHLKMQVDVVALFSQELPSEPDLAEACSMLSEGGAAILVSEGGACPPPMPGMPLCPIDLNQAFMGLVERRLEILRSLDE